MVHCSYKFTFCDLMYCVSPLSLHIQSTDSVILASIPPSSIYFLVWRAYFHNNTLLCIAISTIVGWSLLLNKISENVFRTVTVAAVCVAGAGYMILFLIGIAAGVMALCRGALAVPLLSEVMCWLHGVLTFYHRATSVWRAIIHLTGLWVVQFIRVSYSSCQLSVQTWALSLPFLYPGHTETPEHYLIVLTNFCWCICFTFILPHDNNFSV